MLPLNLEGERISKIAIFGTIEKLGVNRDPCIYNEDLEGDQSENRPLHLEYLG
jgi:hypothetical protein